LYELLLRKKLAARGFAIIARMYSIQRGTKLVSEGKKRYKIKFQHFRGFLKKRGFSVCISVYAAF